MAGAEVGLYELVKPSEELISQYQEDFIKGNKEGLVFKASELLLSSRGRKFLALYGDEFLTREEVPVNIVFSEHTIAFQMLDWNREEILSSRFRWETIPFRSLKDLENDLKDRETYYWDKSLLTRDFDYISETDAVGLISFLDITLLHVVGPENNKVMIVCYGLEDEHMPFYVREDHLMFYKLVKHLGRASESYIVGNPFFYDEHISHLLDHYLDEKIKLQDGQFVLLK